MAFGIIFGDPRDNFHGDLILERCYTIMFKFDFPRKIKLWYPNHNENPPQVWMKDAKGSFVMWRKESMKLVFIFQYFGLGLTNNGLWEYFRLIGCWCFLVITKHMIEFFCLIHIPLLQNIYEGWNHLYAHMHALIFLYVCIVLAQYCHINDALFVRICKVY